MTALELRTEIYKAIENAPESVLPEILDYLHNLEKPTFDKEKLDQFIDKVFKEDDNLLRRLAQ
ncbi:MAG: hypothetical protein ABI367_03325 [Mucilaginibacter sp.]